MASDLQVVVVDDDAWKRDGMCSRLAAFDRITVADAVDQDSAAAWTSDRWVDVDVVMVDVFDDRAPGEMGTDLYSGIRVVERVRRLPVRCVAVTPSCAHPLVQLRLRQAAPDYCYHRYQISTLDELVEAIHYPARDRQVPELTRADLRDLGAERLLANDVVATFEASELHGRLHAQAGIKELAALGVSRHTIRRFRQEVVALGYRHIDTLSGSAQDEYRAEDTPRWPVVRELTLKLLGRLDGPWSEFDRPWW